MKVKSRKIRIYPTLKQKNLFNQWFGVSRKVYNTSVDYYNKNDKESINWMVVSKHLFNDVLTESYVKKVPYQIKKIAVKDCYIAFTNGCKKAKQSGETFKLSFRTRKDPKQSCYIPKSALSYEGIYKTLSGSLKMKERWLLNNDYCDLRLVREYNKWYIIIPVKLSDTMLPVSDNQRMGDVVALDPGIRSFMTFFSENGYFGSIGNEFKRLNSLQHKLDKLISKKDLYKDKKKKRNLYRHIGTIRKRIEFLVDELHWKTINFLVRNFKVILLPTFETSDMVKKDDRKINKSVVRSMRSYRFYEFGERLKNKCEEYGVCLIRTNESYTSKTNSFTGEIFNIGSRKSFKYDGVTVDRDINGARNILLRAMRDHSLQG